WHLLKNMREAVQRFLTRQHACLEQATAAVPQSQLLEQTTTAGTGGDALVAECTRTSAQPCHTLCALLSGHRAASTGYVTQMDRQHPRDQSNHRPHVHPRGDLSGTCNLPTWEPTRSLSGFCASA